MSYPFQFLSGNAALDFINTIADRFDPEKAEDHLRSGKDVRRWAFQANLPDPGILNRGGVLRVRGVREQLFSIFLAIARNKPVSSHALRHVDKAFRACQSERCLVAKGKKIGWDWRTTATNGDLLLYAILTPAVELLTSKSPIKLCAGKGCGWLFLDRSNSGKRRWCSMADCGNRNKAQRFYRQTRGS